MATATMERSKSKGWGCLLFLTMLAFIVAVLALNGKTERIPALNDHAVERHGQKATSAWEYVLSLGPANLFCRYQCPDGRTRYICPMESGHWTMVVLEDGYLITSFVVNQSYAKGEIDKCKNRYHYRNAHP